MVEKITGSENLAATQLLWRNYQSIRIRVYHHRIWHQPFAIMTAANPRSKVLTPDENLARQSRLSAQLDAREVRYSPVLVGNEDFSYCEPSLAIVCNHSDAKALCEQWRQNAYYFVEDGKLSLHSVLLTEVADCELGRFCDFTAQN